MRSASVLCIVAVFAGSRTAGGQAARPIIVDTHSDSTQRITYDQVDFGKLQPGMHQDLIKMKQGGLSAQFFSIWIDPNQFKPDQFYAEALHQFEAVHALVRKYPQAIAWARSAAEVRDHARRGLISALFGVEGGHALEPGAPTEQLEHLRKFYQLGARYMTLTWSNSNAIGGSSGDAGEVQGLTEFGRRVLDEMQRLGMIADISHVSDPLFWDVVRYVKKPVLASHSSARALANVPRNMTDAMLKAVAKNGGAVCVNFFPGFLDDGFAKALRPMQAKLRGLANREREKVMKAETRKLEPVPLSRLIDHIDHIAKVAGVEHVCLGSDFDGVPALPVGMEDVSKLPAIAAELRRRGYGEADVAKILGENTLRVLEANEAH